MRQTNLFIFNSRKQHKRYIRFALLFYVLFFFSFALLVLKPSIFYWRAWEYFDEISYCIPDKLKWEGYEYGDAARIHIYSFQDKWKTHASADEEGFRSVPFGKDNFPILIVGDSHTWGCGLSDHETIPWGVAKRLNVPVFNGGRKPYTLGKILKNPRLKETKILIELLTEHLIDKHLFEGSSNAYEGYTVYAQEKSYKNYFKISPNRYFLPLKFFRSTLLKLNIKNELTKSTLDAYRIPFKGVVSLKCKEHEFEEAIQKIVQRSNYFESLGYTYVVGFIPEKGIQLAYHLDPSDLQHERCFAEKLSKANVRCIDICKVFREIENPRLLFFPTDCHINSVGADVIAREIAAYIRENFARETFLKSDAEKTR